MLALPRTAQLYMVALWAIAPIFALLTLVAPAPAPAQLFWLPAWVVLYALAEHRGVSFEIGARMRLFATLGETVQIFLAVVAGPAGALAVVLGSLLSGAAIRQIWYRNLFNTAVRLITYSAITLITCHLVTPGSIPFSGLAGLLALALIIVSFTLLDHLLVATMMGLVSGQPLREVYRASMAQTSWLPAVTLPSGAIIAALWTLDPLLAVVASLPLLIAFRALAAIGRLQAEVRRSAALSEELGARKLEAERATRMAALGTFAAGLAHEFNNLLAAILGYAQLALTSQSAAEKDEALEIAIRACVRGRSITGGLLTFARQGETRQSPADLRAVVLDTLTMVERDMARDQIQVERQIGATPPVRCDAGQIAQALLNLLSNARDALRPVGGGTISVTLSHAGGFVELSVRDTGAGIADAVRQDLFKPFASTKSFLSGSESGLGLGLAITHGIIERHRGSIRVESAPGHGTTMTLVLPVDASALAQLEQAGALQLPRMRLLLLEQPSGAPSWLERLLTAAGQEVESVTSVEAAQRALRGGRFAAVVADVGASDCDAAPIAALGDAAPRVVAIVEGSCAEHGDALRRAGACSVVLRPFTPGELMDEIMRCARRQL